MWWLIGLVLAVGLLPLIGLVQTRRIRMTACCYADSSVPPAFDGFRIVQISDYHDSPHLQHGRPLLDAVRAESPDLIVLTGDLFNRRTQDGCQNALALVKEAVGIAPVFFVEGNHERRLRRYPQWREMLISCGVVVLENDAVCLLRGGDMLRIVGLRQYFDTAALRSLCDANGCNLVLSHRCECALQYRAAGASLILTGHAHGGQIRLFGRGVFGPEQGILPRYAAGLYRIGRAAMHVSRGIGNTIRFPRIFNVPEWNLITLSRTGR